MSSIIEEAKKVKPDIIALSALMTTTMVRMPEVMAGLKAVGLNPPVMVGGAVVTPRMGRKKSEPITAVTVLKRFGWLDSWRNAENRLSSVGEIKIKIICPRGFYFWGCQ